MVARAAPEGVGRLKGRRAEKRGVVRNDTRTIAHSYNLLTTCKREVEMSNALINNDSYNLTTLTTKVRKGDGVVVERFAREGVGRKDVRGTPAPPPSHPVPAPGVAAAPSDAPAPASPCIGSCGLDDAGRCRGCGRTAAEIAGWRGMGDAERRRVLGRIAARGVDAGGAP